MANERDFIWQQQGASSFVKIKMDWARFGKIHFSFVQHSGKPACKQVASIEAALKVDGGDGALYLAEAVKNNTMERRRAKALEDQKASGAKYPAPMFTSMGGTTAQRSKTGQCVFRQVSLVPGMKTDYALQVVEADGEQTATGGISMKKGAQVTRITVGLKREELLSMASAILMAWQAYMIASSAYGTLGAKPYQWLRSGGWDEDLIVDAEPAVTTKCGRPMSSARASQTVGMMPAYYGEVAEDLLKLVQLRKGEFSAEMQQRLLFYIYVYSVLKISYKRDGDAPAAEAVRAADALMRHPMTPEMLEQRISGLRASARYDRTSVSRNRVISDLQITVAEQKQLKRLLGHEEDLRRKSKSGMLRSERDAALDTAIVEMLAQGKLHREIGEKLGMARESVTRRIRRNNLLREVQEARNALAKEQARAKRAEKTKDKDDDDKNGGAGAGGTQAASKPQKKSSRKPMSESRRLAVLAVQRVRRAKERLARKCSICIRNLAKRYYRLNAARVEWIGSASAAESPCNTPFPQLC